MPRSQFSEQSYIRTFCILESVMEEKLPGEDLITTAGRLLIEEALIQSFGDQDRAATLLGISNRRINYMLGLLSLRPKDGCPKEHWIDLAHRRAGSGLRTRLGQTGRRDRYSRGNPQGNP